MPKKTALRVGIVFDDTLDSNDGVAQYVKGLGNWLSQQGHHVVYLVGETKLQTWAGGKVYSLSKNLKVIFNGNRMSIPLPAKRRRISQVLEAEALDVLHVQTPYSPFLAQKVLKLAGPRTAEVGTFHVFPSGLLSKVGSRLLYLFQIISLKRIGSVLAVSPVAARFAKQTFGLQTVPSSNLVDLKKFQTDGSQTQKNRIVFLGRLVKRKGCRELIEAFYLLQQNLPEARLVIAGDGPERASLERLVRSRGLSDKVSFLGFIGEADKPKLLASAHIACFPSLGGESFGIVLIEAMAAGSQVVLGGDNPGYRSVLGEQEVLLVDPRRTKDFAGRLEELLSDETLASKLHDWQMQHVKTYDVNVVGRQVLSVYYDEIAKKRAGGDN